MQIICTVSLSPDRYAKENFQRSIRRPIHAPAVALGMRLPHLVIIRETLQARAAAFYKSLCAGSDVVFAAEQSAFFHRSHSHIGWS